jgi:serine/threonine protein kinase
MTSQPLSADESPSLMLRLEEACGRFEAAWQAGGRPRIEEYLSGAPELDRAAFLRELLLLELSYRRQHGESPVMDEYRRRFPEHPAVVQAVVHRQAWAVERQAAMGEPPDPLVATTPETAGGHGVEWPHRLGRYRVERLLGEGSFGLVYLAHDDQLHRPVAVKVPHRERISSPEDVAAYLAEARILASLEHPHIVPVHDVGATENGLPFVVSKFIEGCDLKERIEEARPAFSEAAALVATIAEALHYAHRKGLVHRDIKPANILIDAAGEPHVADFGLALKEEDFGKGAGFAGTPAYMSPEQARGDGDRVDGRSDIFSLGVVLYELLTGRRPFPGETRSQLLEQIATIEARPPRQIDDAIPKELERICLKALAKRASDRYTTAKDMADDLRGCRTHMTTSGEAAQPKGYRAASQNKKRPRFVWVSLALVVLGLVAGTLIILAKTGSLGSPESDTDPSPVENFAPPFHIKRTPPEKSNFVELFHVKWLGGSRGTVDIYGNEIINMARIINPDVDDVCDVNDACCFAFELQSPPGIPWVRVDGIDIIVEDYERPFGRVGVFAGASQEEHTNVYYVELENQFLGEVHTFSATYFFSDRDKTRPARNGEGKRAAFTFVRLIEAKPQAFAVRVNATTPGRYTFSCVARLSYKDEESRQTIISSETWFFHRSGQKHKPSKGR